MNHETLNFHKYANSINMLQNNGQNKKKLLWQLSDFGQEFYTLDSISLIYIHLNVKINI